MTTKSCLGRWAAALLIGAVAVTGAVGASAAERVNWKMHSAFPSKLKILGSGALRVVEEVEAVSQGSFRIRFYEPNALLPAFDFFDGISEGSVPMAWSIASLHGGRKQALAFFGAVPFGPGAGEFLAWLKYGGGQALHDELYHGLGMHPVLCGIFPPEASGWFRKEVKTTADLRGMKFRIGGFGAKVLEQFGVSTQLIAGGDIYPALELGSLDATEFSMPVIDEDLGFYQIAKHYYFPGWHQQSTQQHLDINKKAYDELSDYHKRGLKVSCGYNIAEAIAEGEGLQFGPLKRMQEKGVTLHRWSDEVLGELNAAWAKVIEEAAASDADVKRVWDSYTAFRAEYAVWRKLGYLD